MGLIQRSFVLACFCASTVLAQDIQMMHDAWWRVEGRDVTIYVSQISNFGTEETGPLFLSLYVQGNSAYNVDQPVGQLVARVPIGSIGAGGQLNAQMYTARARIRPGPKFSALMLERQDRRRYSIVQWIAFTSVYNLARKQDGGVGSDDSAIGAGNISISSVAISVQGRRATFDVAEIKSLREGGQSGATDTGLLRLAVYATAQPYEGGPLEGQLIGMRLLGTLAPGDYYTGLHGTINLKKPRGRDPYYTTLAIEEEQESGFVPLTAVSAPPQ